MYIGGFTPTSFVDFPGEICSTLFIAGCNFRCGFCHNPPLAQAQVAKQSFALIKNYLEQAKGKKIDGVCITGGEPTLYKNLPELIREIKALGLLVKVDTNGSHPHILKELECDYVAMDIKTVPKNYDQFIQDENIWQKVLTSIKWLQKQRQFDYEFRTTLVPGFTDQAKLQEIAKLIEPHSKWFLQPFDNRQTLDPSYQELQTFNSKEITNWMNELKKEVPEVALRGLN